MREHLNPKSCQGPQESPSRVVQLEMYAAMHIIFCAPSILKFWIRPCQETDAERDSVCFVLIIN